MQDRIKLMAVEAGIDLDPHGGIARAYPVNLERFAQAVARGCAEMISAKLATPHIDQLSAEGWSVAETNAYSTGLEGVECAIRARFGIEGE